MTVRQTMHLKGIASEASMLAMANDYRHATHIRKLVP